MHDTPDLPTAWRNFSSAFVRETGFERLALWLLSPGVLNRAALFALVAVVVAYVGGSVWMTFPLV